MITCSVLVVPTVREAKVSDGGVRETVGAAARPVPDNVTECGLPGASLVTVSAPVRGPVAVGVNVTLIVHDVLAARVVAQALAWLKSPVATMELKLSGARPVLVRVIACGALVVPTVPAARVSVGGVRETPGVDAMPVPDNVTECGLPGASLVTVSAPVRGPVAVGVNVTLIVHVALAARLAGQALVWLKSPEATMELTLSSALPVLVRVIACGALVVATVRAAKVSDGGERETAGAGASDTIVVTVIGDGFV